MQYTYALADVGFPQLSRVGGKAASLGKLMAANIAVPSGFIITAEASQLGMSPALRSDVLKSFKRLGAPRVAVRSSAVGEDSDQASWAGQLESYLNVTEDGLLAAIEKCWASTSSDHAREYARFNQIPDDSQPVAVIVQTMVDSDVSGVLFTANPVTSNCKELIIESIYGLGELIVQGAVTPDSWTIDRQTGKVITSSPRRQTESLQYKNGQNQLVGLPSSNSTKPSLRPAQLKALRAVAEQIELLYGQPQDIEWAISAGKIHILQSRPITTLQTQLPPQPTAPSGVKYALTVPQSVLFADLTCQGCLRPAMLQALGIDFEVAYLSIDAGGAIYFNYDSDKAFDAAFLQDRPPEDALDSFIYAMAATARKLQRRSSLASSNLRRSGNQADILADLQEYWQAYKLHMASLCNFWNVENILAKAITDELQANGHDTASQGLDQFIKSKETNQFVRERACFKKIVRRFTDGQRRVTIKKASPELIAALQHHIREFAFQLTPFNLGQAPRAADLIPRINEVMQELGTTDYEPTEPLPDLRLSYTPKLRRLLHVLEQMTFWKNERVDVMSMADASMELLYQDAADSLGLQLQELFCMTTAEIATSLQTGKPAVSKQILAERAQVYCMILHNGTIEFYQPTPPDNKASRGSGEAVSLQGVASSPGLATGKVRLVLNLEESAKLKTGEILVTTMTRPEMGVALDRAAGFVTNEGGLLCHAAIISREMKKPCVIATIHATKLLKNGDLIEVDGSNGTVRLVSSATA